MSSVASGVREIRVRTDLQHRVIYVAKFEDGVYVLHAFEKKSRKTAQGDIDLAKRRYRDLVQQRERQTASGKRKG